MHIESPDEKGWIQDHVEGAPDELTPDEKRHILGRLNAAEALEQFLGRKYIGQKRFGIDGAESAIPVLDAILAEAADQKLDSAVMGMAHRGRLNVLVNIVGKSYDQLFKEFEGNIDPESIQGSGDVKYHLGQTGKFVSPAGNTITVDLAANPSHLEAVDPVVVGMARAKMDKIEPPGDYPVLPVLIHGDAAFAGQGVVAETLNLSNIHGYKVGGTIHLIVNNQLGFTTPPEAARSSEYPTDVAKMVAGADLPRERRRPRGVRARRPPGLRLPQALAQGRRHRHGLLPPARPQRGRRPQLHPARDVPAHRRQALGAQDLHRAARQAGRHLHRGGRGRARRLPPAPADRARRDQAGRRPRRPDAHAARRPSACCPTSRPASPATGSTRCSTPSTRCPTGFTVHPKLGKQLATRATMFREEGEVDWALGEALAIGSLLDEGTSVRLAGEDSRRGTFSQRHLVLVDYETGAELTPLASLAADKAHFWLYDSLLSEFAALGFEYGYSVESKDTLVIWEAQFGDFVNGAQVIIDQFITAGEDKWEQTSGLVMLLPHGYEGQGPEHSSARIERFLTLAAEDNIQVCNATTAAQYFHLLRRQMKRELRKPLVIFTPKSLLRAKAARSPVADLESGSFQEVLDDPELGRRPGRGAPHRVRLGQGGRRGPRRPRRRPTPKRRWPSCGSSSSTRGPSPTSPPPLERYPNADEIVWLQEEPENMGPWNFIKGNLYEHHGDTHAINRVSRIESGSPASGVKAVHDQEQADLLSRALTLD